jgi:hypothetical protein
MKKHCEMPEAATGDEKLATEITDKKGYARRWQGSPRWIDGLLAQGLPHLKIGARRVRICIPEADAWMREQFHTQRIGKAATQ